ncbi:MAG: ketoacyl-synthetase C-terminal extension domain-containing protein, partial [Pseudomonadales bacterium]
SGVASLLKVLGCFESKLLPPTPCADPLEFLDEQGFRLLSEPAPWEAEGPRRAAISNFGFGGNNAHMIVEEWTGTGTTPASEPLREGKAPPRVAISANGVLAGERVGFDAFVRDLLAPRAGGVARAAGAPGAAAAPGDARP